MPLVPVGGILNFWGILNSFRNQMEDMGFHPSKKNVGKPTQKIFVERVHSRLRI